MNKLNVVCSNDEQIVSLAQHYIMESFKNNRAIEIPVLNLTIKGSCVSESPSAKSNPTLQRTSLTLRR